MADRVTEYIRDRQKSLDGTIDIAVVLQGGVGDDEMEELSTLVYYNRVEDLAVSSLDQR